MADYRDHWYDSDYGLRLYARDYAGPADSARLPALCMHGLSRNSRDFAELARHLSRERRVIVAEQRGRGSSAWDPDPSHYTPQTYVGDMFRLLEGLGVEQAVLIGTSMGGLMAFLMASMQPSRFPGLVINDIGPEIDPVGLARIQSYVGKTPAIRSWDDAVAHTREINEAAFPDYTDAEWLAFARNLYVEQDGIPVLAYDPAISEPMADPEGAGAVPPDLWPLFDAIRAAPMLVLRGELSDILSAECLARMHALKHDLVSVIVPRTGHAPMLTEPVALEAIDAFLDDLRAEG